MTPPLPPSKRPPRSRASRPGAAPPPSRAGRAAEPARGGLPEATAEAFATDNSLVHAPKQTRGVARQRDVIEAGLRLVQSRSLDEITMEQVAREAGCSVGNLYKRFAGKEALLWVLVDAARERLTADMDAMADRVRSRRGGLDAAVREVIGFEVEVLRRYRGLVRGVCLHRLQHGQGAGPGLGDLRERFHRRAAEALRPLLPAGPRPAEAGARLEFALQVSLGSLLEMTVFEAGARSIDDRDLVTRMTALVLACLRDP